MEKGRQVHVLIIYCNLSVCLTKTATHLIYACQAVYSYSANNGIVERAQKLSRIATWSTSDVAGCMSRPVVRIHILSRQVLGTGDRATIASTVEIACMGTESAGRQVHISPHQ